MGREIFSCCYGDKRLMTQNKEDINVKKEIVNLLRKWFDGTFKRPLMLAAAVLILIVIALMWFQVKGNKPQEAEVSTSSTLEKIIEISDLDTFTSVYNGIAAVMNEKNPDKVDYYVAYKAQVYAGIDFEQVNVEVDEETKKIMIRLPDAKINNVDVDESSLDFMFFNDNANTTAVTAQALKACEEDVGIESAQENAIFELAQENAENIVKALTVPIVEQWEEGYEIEVE